MQGFGGRQRCGSLHNLRSLRGSCKLKTGPGARQPYLLLGALFHWSKKLGLHHCIAAENSNYFNMLKLLGDLAKVGWMLSLESLGNPALGRAAGKSCVNHSEEDLIPASSGVLWDHGDRH